MLRRGREPAAAARPAIPAWGHAAGMIGRVSPRIYTPPSLARRIVATLRNETERSGDVDTIPSVESAGKQWPRAGDRRARPAK